jgi:hypothetical protein
MLGALRLIYADASLLAIRGCVSASSDPQARDNSMQLRLALSLQRLVVFRQHTGPGTRCKHPDRASVICTAMQRINTVCVHAATAAELAAARQALLEVAKGINPHAHTPIRNHS